MPVYNGAAFIADTLRVLLAYLSARAGGAELIVVDDGSTDGTSDRLRQAAAGARVPVRIVRNARNLGKGAAIARGMQVARGAYRVFIDADLAYPPGEIDRICAALSAGADLAIASRMHRQSRLLLSPVFVRYFYLRHEVGRFLNRLVRLFLLPRIMDTQAGLKGFRAAAAQQLFAGWLPRGFSFDVALLFRSRRLGLRIEQVPVLYRYLSEPSTVRFVRDTARVLRDLVQIRMRLVSGRFEQWHTVVGGWRGRARALLETITAPAVLVTLFGVSMVLLIAARLSLSQGGLAVVGWLGTLLPIGLWAWRADRGQVSQSRRLFRSPGERNLFVLIFVVCALLRFVRLGTLPPMIHGDSAECGLQGLMLLDGKVGDVFNFSDWYWTPYLSFVPYAASFLVTGPSIVGLRLPSALLGVATLVPLYFLVRGWFGIRAAMLVAALYAFSHSAIHFSRIGLWNMQVLFYEVTAFALLSRGLRRGSALWMTLAGIVSGLALYSYTAGRLIPIIAVPFLVAQLTRTQWRRVARGIAYFSAGMLVTVVPLVINYIKDPTVLDVDRTASVWVLSAENQAHVESTLGTSSTLGILWEQTRRTLAGFVTMGDASTQYGTWQPLLSPITAVLGLAGLALVLWRWREPRYLFLLLWLMLGLILGSILIIDPPSHTRLIVLFPVPYILAALGLDAMLRRARGRIAFHGANVLALYVLVVAQSAAFSLSGYYKFTQKMLVESREWDVLMVLERSGPRYDYYLYTGPFLLADSPIFRLFSTGTRAVNGFSEMDLPDRLARDATFVLTPDFRRIGMAISERFPGAEREVLDQQGVRQLLVYRCTADNGCRHGRS